jgi:hypothetical protein
MELALEWDLGCQLFACQQPGQRLEHVPGKACPAPRCGRTRSIRSYQRDEQNTAYPAGKQHRNAPPNHSRDNS